MSCLVRLAFGMVCRKTSMQGVVVAVIETSGLTKFYGDAPGIIDLELEVKRGEVFGFLGPNGAGKSTTIRLLFNFLMPSRGSASILGLDMVKDSVEIRRRTGYLPGDLALYGHMTAREVLIYFSNLRRLDTTRQVAKLAERFELDLDRKIKDYSTGNRQKVGLVNAFMHEPELLILDEPTSGLDPLMQQEFYALVEETRDEGRTVFLSSHILPEVERLADRVGIVREQRLITVDTIDSFRTRSRATITIAFVERPSASTFRNIPSVLEVDDSGDPDSLVLTVEGPVDLVLKEAAKYKTTTITTDTGDLEDVFLSYYAGTNAS